MPMVVTLDDVRDFARELPRSTEAVVRGRVKFRVGRIVYLAFSRDETVMGFAFPKDWREALVASEPEKFMLPTGSDLRYQWALVRLAAIDLTELHELVLDAWAMVVPKSVAAAYAAGASSHSERARSSSAVSSAVGASSSRSSGIGSPLEVERP